MDPVSKQECLNQIFGLMDDAELYVFVCVTNPTAHAPRYDLSTNAPHDIAITMLEKSWALMGGAQAGRVQG